MILQAKEGSIIFIPLSETVAALDLNSCIIYKDGQIVFEQYRTSDAFKQIAKINSCTKSILSALICIAMDQGLLPASETKASEFFPRLATALDSRKQNMTLEHLLTMTAGFNWTEFGGQNSFPNMTRTPDWVEFVLNLPLTETPGTRFEYNSGVSQLLSALLVQATGMPVSRYAELNLFGPLGIEQYQWECDPQSIHTGGFGLSLSPLDMLKFGQLFLQEGHWEGTQIISKNRLTDAIKPVIPVESPRRGSYAWHWWTDTYPDQSKLTAHPQGFDYYYARGFGGQYIHVVPSLFTVVILTNDRRLKKQHAIDVFREHIAPLLLN